MTKRYLNIDPDGDYVLTDSQHFKDRIQNGLRRPISSQVYNMDRGTRIDEAVDKPTNIAEAYIIFYLRNYIKKYYPQISEATFKVASVFPLSIQWQFDLKEDI